MRPSLSLFCKSPTSILNGLTVHGLDPSVRLLQDPSLSVHTMAYSSMGTLTWETFGLVNSPRLFPRSWSELVSQVCLISSPTESWRLCKAVVPVCFYKALSHVFDSFSSVHQGPTPGLSQASRRANLRQHFPDTTPLLIPTCAS